MNNSTVGKIINRQLRVLTWPLTLKTSYCGGPSKWYINERKPLVTKSRIIDPNRFYARFRTAQIVGRIQENWYRGSPECAHPGDTLIAAHHLWRGFHKYHIQANEKNFPRTLHQIFWKLVFKQFLPFALPRFCVHYFSAGKWAHTGKHLYLAEIKFEVIDEQVNDGPISRLSYWKLSDNIAIVRRNCGVKLENLFL